MDRKNRRGVLNLRTLAVAVLLLLPLAGAYWPTPVRAADRVFAVVDGETVTEAQFQSFLIEFARNKFYHRVPEGGLAAVKEEAAEALILQRLLVHEAKRRDLAGDPEAVEAQMTRFEERYKGTEAWQQLQEQEPRLRESLLERSKVSALEDQIRQVEDPGDAELRAFYQVNLELFTEPARAKLMVILIGVPPWESAATWDEARRQAEALATQIAEGTSFSDTARAHSTHVSAEQGGDLGFVHSGMLSAPAQEAVDALRPGGVSPPVRVLEGYTLFRLEERSQPQVREFAEVRARVLKLYQRERSQARWEDFLTGLRSKTKIVKPVMEGSTQSE